MRARGSILVALCAALAVDASLTCKDEKGQPVDYWFAIKAPAGTTYLYYDVNTKTLVQSANSLNSTTVGALPATLNQLWDESSTEFLMYNDEPLSGVPFNETSSTGHTKGVWAWNTQENTGIILQHSVPLFPRGPNQVPVYAGLGGNAWTYAQHLACFSFSMDDMDSLAVNAKLTFPDIYDTRTSADTPSNLLSLAKGTISTAASCNKVAVQTSGGLGVSYFAKSSQWNNELYSECIAPALQAGLSVETWIRGSAEGPSCSNSEEVLDVQSLEYSSTIAFKETQDHSKWAVATSGNPWVCPADINRMTTQFARGGSAYCFQDSNLASILRSAITATDSC